LTGWQDTAIARQFRSRIVQALFVPQESRFESSLAAALLSSLVKHPTGRFSVVPRKRYIKALACQNSFPTFR
jgi:hypothetical protein